MKGVLYSELYIFSDNIPSDIDRSSESSANESEPESVPSSGEDNGDEAPRFVVKIRKAAQSVRSAGLAEALTWIEKRLSGTADDREEDGV